MDSFTRTLFVPTVGIVICSDLPTLIATEAVELLSDTLVRFFVEVVVAK